MSQTPEPPQGDIISTKSCKRPFRVVIWGTYDTGKPRTRNLIAGLRTRDWEIIECHIDVWRGVEDKTQLKGGLTKLYRLGRWLFSYPPLLLRYLFLPKHDLVLVCYMGQLDVLLLWPLARLRGVPLVWDALISLYNTTVGERAFVDRNSLIARLLYTLEWLGVRAADRILANTVTATRYFVDTFGIPEEKAQSLLVGVETHAFPPRPAGGIPQGPIRVLFYGTLIPLHGIRYVLEAALLAADEDILWEIIGSGQEEALIVKFMAEHHLPRVHRESWVPYDQLSARMQVSKTVKR